MQTGATRLHLSSHNTSKALYAIEIQEDRQSRWLRHTSNISNIFQ